MPNESQNKPRHRQATERLQAVSLNRFFRPSNFRPSCSSTIHPIQDTISSAPTAISQPRPNSNKPIDRPDKDLSPTFRLNDPANMKQVFISYRHVNPDENLVRVVAAHLKACGYSVFIDVDIRLGEDWVNAIEAALLNSDCLVVFLSKESIGSDMVRSEVNIAHKNGKHILPIRIGLTGDLPYDLGAYLHRSQCLVWNREISAGQLAVLIGEAIPKVTVSKTMQAQEISYKGETDPYDRPDANAVPLPSSDPRLVASIESGTLQLSSPFYIRREADAIGEQCLDSAEATTIVRGPRQMGKSSLLARLHARAQQLGRKSFYVDFQLVDSTHMIDLDHLFRFLARQFQRAFNVSTDPIKAWEGLDGPKGNITNYIEDAILASEHTPVHVIFDEAERLFEMPYRNDFFSTLRGWHNLRATNSRFSRFCVFIGHADTPLGWIQDINQSPFNVGQRIILNGFEATEVAELNRRYGSPLGGDDEIRQLIDFLGGHAYLTRLALYALARRQCSFTELMQFSHDPNSPFSDHLRHMIWMLSKTPEIRDSFQQILLGRPCQDETHYQCLWAVGLISGETRAEARPRSQLYRSYFSRHL